VVPNVQSFAQRLRSFLGRPLVAYLNPNGRGFISLEEAATISMNNINDASGDGCLVFLSRLQVFLLMFRHDPSKAFIANVVVCSPATAEQDVVVSNTFSHDLSRL
jgi:hypothetical protein